MRKLAVSIGLVILGIGGFAAATFALDAPGEHSACVTASVSVPGATTPGVTTPDTPVNVYTSPVSTVPGVTVPGVTIAGAADSQTACVTATDQTVTSPGQTVTVTTTVGTTAPPPPPPPPPPSPPPVGQANLFVAPSGTSTCTRVAAPVSFANAAGHICSTPLKACQLGQSGDVVIVEDGSYSVNFQTCSGHESYASNVIFKPEPGHECPMSYPIPGGTLHSCAVNLISVGDMFVGANGNSSCGVSGKPLPSTLSAAQRSSWINHLTFQGIYFDYFELHCTAFLTFKNIASQNFGIYQGNYQTLIDGGDFNTQVNAAASQPKIGGSTAGTGNWPPSENVTLQGAFIRDYGSTGGHGDGLFVGPSYNLHIIKNVIARDDCIPFYANWFNGSSGEQALGIHGLWVIGNVIHTDLQRIPGEPRCDQALSLGNNNQYDTIAAFNSVSTNTIGIRRSNTTEANTNIRIVGNVAPEIVAASGGNSDGCGSGTTAAYNVLTLNVSNCGSSSNTVNAGLPFVSEDVLSNAGNIWTTPTLGDYALVAGTSAIGKVPVSWCATDSATQAVCAALATDVNGNPRPNPAHPSFYDAGAYENR